MSADFHSAVGAEALAHDGKSGAVGNHAYATSDSDARTDRVNLRNGGHNNRNPVGVEINKIRLSYMHNIEILLIHDALHIFLGYSRQVDLKINFIYIDSKLFGMLCIKQSLSILKMLNVVD